MTSLHPITPIAVLLGIVVVVSPMITPSRRDKDRNGPGSAEPIRSSTSGSREVIRFAATGKASLRRMALSGDRSCERVIGSLLSNVSVESADAEVRFKEALFLPVGERGQIQLAFETVDPAIWESAQGAARRIEMFVAPRWLPHEPIRVRALHPGDARAHASAFDRSISLVPGETDIGTAIHEIAHHLEFSHPEILQSAKWFIARRGKGGPVLRLSQLTGILAYEPDEVAVAGNWPQRGGLAYSGKFYGRSLREAPATEAVSTGLERLLRDPRRMFREDADYFLFLLLCVQVE
jgi:hypothetical protein